jgi:UDP-N-acetylmuramate dehydrogenase
MTYIHSSATDVSTPVTLPGTDCLLMPNFSLTEMTSFRVGGPAQWFVAPTDLQAVRRSFEWAMAQDLPVTLLGAGSNLLISDRGLPGLVISTKHLRYLDLDPQTGRMVVGAGRGIPQLAHQAAKLGLAGLEWAVGIPGTVGGAVVMNAGAHGGCTAEHLVSAQVLEPDGSVSDLALADLGYMYRTSVLQGSQRLVLQATFHLQAGQDPEQVKALTQEHLSHRLQSQPYNFPSCGSVFRNPQEHSAGWFIEQTGLKGFQIGQAQVAERHANFILNRGGASASDIFNLIHHVQQQVADRWAVLLRPEVKILGEFTPLFA